MRAMLRGLWFGTTLLVSTAAAEARELSILLSNDDGFEAPGLVEMREALVAAGHRVVVVAPRTDQSGTSVRISTTPLKVTEEQPGVWVVDGSPADSVLFGLLRVFGKSPPDLVVSGSNRGQNLGAVTNLSGTVGAGVIAAMNRVPAIAVSVGIDFAEAAKGFPSTAAAYPAAAEFTANLVSQLMQAAATGPLLPIGTVLNVNYPALPPAAIKGAQWAPVSAGFGYSVEYRDGDEPGTVKLAFGPDPAKYAPGAPDDTAQFAAGAITVSLLEADRGAPRALRRDVATRLGSFVQP